MPPSLRGKTAWSCYLWSCCVWLGGGAGEAARAGLGAGGEPALPVGAHVLDDRQQRQALPGQRVLDARRDLGVGVALDDPLLLQRAQAQGEGARADALQRALELAEPRVALREIANEQQRP